MYYAYSKVREDRAHCMFVPRGTKGELNVSLNMGMPGSGPTTIVGTWLVAVLLGQQSFLMLAYRAKLPLQLHN